MTTELKDPFNSPIETAMINISAFSGKTPTNMIPRPKSFNNLRKASLDTYSAWKNSGNVSQFQSCTKPQNNVVEKTHEISQSLLNHLKILNNNSNGSINFDPNLLSLAKKHKTTHLNASVSKNSNIDKTPSNSKSHHIHNNSMNTTIFNQKGCYPNAIPTNTANTNSKDKGLYKQVRPNSTTNSNKKFIDLYKRGGSITNVQVSVNLSSKPGISLNSSHNNISNASSVTNNHNNKGKSSHYYENSNSSHFGKDLENHVINMIQELQAFNSGGNFENMVRKMLDFLKRIPGLDPLFIALIGKLEEIILTNEEVNKRKIRDLEAVRIKESNSFSQKEKELQSDFDLLQNKLAGFMEIFRTLEKKGVDLKEILKEKEETEVSRDEDDVDEKIGKHLKKRNFKLEKQDDFADESLINDSEESSFGYYGKPETPLSSLRIFQNVTNTNKKPSGFKLNLREVEKRRALEASSQSSESKKENKFLKKK